MRPTLSAAVRATGVPPIPAARVWAQRYGGQAGAPIDLTQAVPGYPAHPELLARIGTAAAGAEAARYGAIAGDLALREALAEDLGRTYRAAFGVDDTAITAGCNLAFAMAMTVLAGPGAAVMLPAPWYFNHHMALTMQGVATVPLPCAAADGFVPDPARAEALLDPRVRAIVLITPNNPTGAVYPPAVLAAFADLCRRRGLFLVIDETYRDFLPPGTERPHDLFGAPDWRDFVVQLYSFSKSYCIPGHRLGAVVAGGAIQAEFAKVLDTMQICPARAGQAGLAWAVPALRDWRESNRALMAGRAAAFRTAMTSLPDWRIDACGAYFAYLRLPEGTEGAMETAERLAGERGLMTLPGPFFGPAQERHLRLAFANAGLDAIAAVPARLRGPAGGR
jgi:aspartate/methionine/tyrosine aminotransferase